MRLSDERERELARAIVEQQVTNGAQYEQAAQTARDHIADLRAVAAERIA